MVVRETNRNSILFSPQFSYYLGVKRFIIWKDKAINLVRQPLIVFGSRTSPKLLNDLEEFPRIEKIT